jgi:hypothetical protein
LVVLAFLVVLVRLLRLVLFTEGISMKLLLALGLALPLAGCGGGLAGVASFGTEVVARGITGKIDNDGGLFGQDTSTINYTPAQNAQRAANNAAVPPRSDKGTTIIQQGGGYPQAGYGGGNPAYINDGPAYDRSYYGGGYGPSYPPYYGRGW